MTPPADKDEGSKLYETYEEYAKTLRAWFVGFGIGGPGFLLANTPLIEALKSKGTLKGAVVSLLVAVVLQILLALINKFANWGNYYFHDNPPDKWAWREGLCDWIARQFWIDMVVDVATAMSLGYAICLMFRAYL